MSLCKFSRLYRKDSTILTYSKIRNFYTSSKISNKNDDKNNDENRKQESPLKRLLDESASFHDIKLPEQQQWATLPYPQGVKIRKQGESFLEKSKQNPEDWSIILFPGQGSQYVGMAKELLRFPMVRDLFELANYILDYDLLKLCLNGPKDKLNQTKYCQPAIMVSSLAAIERLKEERPKAVENCVGTAGFSVGEITALVFAGCLEFERALQLVKIRAEAMQLASEAYKGGMLTAIYGPDSRLGQAIIKAKQWAIDKGDPLPECKVANYLYPHCKVIAGSESALEFLEKNMKEFNLRRLKRLPVSGGFHSDLMQPAVEPFRVALKKSVVNDPVISVYSNVDGKRYRDAQHVRKQLPKQIVKPVKWEQLLHVVYERDPNENFPRTFECGPGTSLKTILKQVNAKAWNNCFTIEA